MLLGKIGGETRVGAGYRLSNGVVSSTGGPSGGDPTGGAGGNTLVTMADTVNGILSSLGSTTTVGSAFGAFEASRKGKGFAYAGGTLSTGQVFGDTNTHNARRGTKTPEKALEDYVSALNDAVVSALGATTDIPEAVKKILSSGLGTKETLAAIQAQMQQMQYFGELVKLLPFENLKNLSYDAKNAVIELNGGLENLSSLLDNYHQNFYSEAEQIATATKNLSNSLGELGLSLPKTTAAYRDLVNAQDLSTEQGRKNYAMLLHMSSTFYQVTQFN